VFHNFFLIFSFFLKKKAPELTSNSSRRVFFLTDMEAETNEFLNIVKKNSDASLFTTVVGVGKICFIICFFFVCLFVMFVIFFDYFVHSFLFLNLKI
jgi:hypothetical protein